MLITIIVIVVSVKMFWFAHIFFSINVFFSTLLHQMFIVGMNVCKIIFCLYELENKKTEILKI